MGSAMHSVAALVAISAGEYDCSLSTAQSKRLSRKLENIFDRSTA